MSNIERKRANSVENKTKPLNYETVVTHKKPDLRNFNERITLLRDAYDKGYANVEYLTTGKIPNGWKRNDGKLANKQVNKDSVEHSLQNQQQQQTPLITINTPLQAPLQAPVTTTIVQPNKLVHDYQDPNKPQLNTIRTKQMSIDEYIKISGKEQSDNHFNQAVDKRKYDKQTHLLALMRQRPSPIPIAAAKRKKK